MASFEQGQRPLNHVRYQSANSNPYGAGDPYYNQSTGFFPPQQPKKGTSPWVKFGIPVAVIVVVAVVVGAVVGTKHSSSDSSSSSSSDPAEAASSAAEAKTSVGIFAVSTDSEFMVPVYPSTVRQISRRLRQF